VIVTVGSASGSLKAEPEECLTGKGQVLSKGLCYDFDWFRLYSRDQRQSWLKMFSFSKTQKNALGFIPKYCLKVELCSSKRFVK